MKKTHPQGQAIVEYAILVTWIIGGLYLIMNEFCTSFDKYVQNIYYVLQLSVP